MPAGRYHHGALRGAVLARAQEILRVEGAAALSLRRIARDLDVSHAAPSRHFRDKQALLDALAVDGFDRLTDNLARAARGRTFRSRLHALARSYLRFATEDAELLELMFTGKHSPEASADLVEAGQRMRAAIREFITAAQDRGDIRRGDPDRIALVLTSACHGLADLVTAGMVSPDEVDRALRDSVDFTVRGLAP